MKNIIIFLALFSIVYGFESYDGLRVKFGWSDALADVEYFFNIPRTVSEAESEGWRRTDGPNSVLPDLRLYCPPGRAVCPLYDTSGFIAGLQIALPVDEYESIAIKPEKKFIKWRAFETEGEPSRDYWTATQYFVSLDSLKAGAGPHLENGATLQDGGVWVMGLDGRLLRIPATEPELNTTTFKKQNCIPNMGTHYYYNMTPEMKCEDMLPWFALATEGELVGTGFQMFGKLAKPQHRDWFEKISPETIPIAVPLGPPCFQEWSSSYGLVSLHIYYIDKPWTIRCRTGDSIQPAPALDRLLLNGHRYASQVADEVKKLFSG